MSFSCPRNPVSSSAPSLAAVSLKDSLLSVPPPMSLHPGVSAYWFSLPNKKYTWLLCIVVGSMPAPITITRDFHFVPMYTK